MKTIHCVKLFATMLLALFLQSFTHAVLAQPTARAAIRPKVGPAEFLVNLESFLGLLAAKGIVSRSFAEGFDERFRQFDRRDPRVLGQGGFEYAIPAVVPFPEPYGNLIADELEKTRQRSIREILGPGRNEPEDVFQLYRRMLMPKKEDGEPYEMFVKETYAALIEGGRFRKADGTTDREALADAVRKDQSVAEAWSVKLAAMRRDGTLDRLARAIGNVTAYAERRSLQLWPMQVRQGLLHLATCIAAKPDEPADLYAESCNRLMTWMGERPHHGAVEVRFRTAMSGSDGRKIQMEPWDSAYAEEVYGAAFGDHQTRASEGLLRKYFELYAGTAKAEETSLAARDSGELLKLEKSVGRTLKLLLALARRDRFEGKSVSDSDIRQSLAEARKLKADLESSVGHEVRSREGYNDTMRGFEQVVTRAKAAGIE